MNDYGAMVRRLMTMAQPVADKTNPLAKGLRPDSLTEGAGAMGSGGGGRTMPLAEFTNGNIRGTQTTVDYKGVQKYIKRIKAGERPSVEITPSAGTIHDGRGQYHISDGHHRLKAY
jgi:hypothetical protein